MGLMPGTASTWTPSSTHSMHLANEFDARPWHPVHLPVPPVLEFVAAAILLLNSFLLIASYGLSTRLPLPLLCS